MLDVYLHFQQVKGNMQIQLFWKIALAGAGVFFLFFRENISGGVMKFIEAYLPYPIKITSSPGGRSAGGLSRVIAQFQVATNPRYTQRDSNTFCNIFLWDVTRALGCEIPHWVLNGISTPPGIGSELNAVGTVAWMRTYGNQNGWRKVTEGEARGAASQGYPAVVLFAPPVGIGHVAVLQPTMSATTLIAQAGVSNFEKKPLSSGFGTRKEPVIEFWVHA